MALFELDNLFAIAKYIELFSFNVFFIRNTNI